MHIDRIRVDRFGNLSDVQVDSLTDGLNVFYDSSSAASQTVAQFLRAMLHGFQSDIRRSYSPAELRGSGGTVAVQTATGHHLVSRSDDGTSDGRLTVQHPDGRVVACHDLREWVKVSDSTYDRVFSIDFERPHDIHELILEGQSSGLELGGRLKDHEKHGELSESLRKQRDHLAALPVINPTLDHLLHRRRVLVEEVHSLTAKEAEFGANRTHRLASIADQIAQLDQQREAVKGQLQSFTQAIDELDSKRLLRLQSVQAVEQPDHSSDALHGRLYQVETRIDRWRDVLQDITRRKQTLQADRDDHAVVAERDNADAADPRRMLRSLESHIRHLQSCMGDLQADSERHVCQCRTLRDIFGPELEEMRADLYRLCQELSRWEQHSAQQGCTNELAQLERCETELRVAVQRLAEQRHNLREDIVSQCDDDAILHEWHGEYCQCHDHPRVRRDTLTPDVDRTALEEEIASLEMQIDRLEQRREKVLADIEDLESELAELREQKRRFEDPVGSFDRERLADLQAELRGVERDIEFAEQRQIHQTIAALEDQLQRLQTTPVQSVTLRDASEYLRRMSAGNLVEIRVDEHGRAWIVDENQVRRSNDQLAAGQQDQAYLAVCLALVAAFQRQGVTMPLVLVGTFANLSAHTVSEAAELLRDFAGHGHQVIVFTRFERVASVFRLLNVNVRHLLTRTAPPVEVEFVVPETVQSLEPLPQEMTAVLEGTTERSWDFEEFPGELTDRVRLRRDFHHTLQADHHELQKRRRRESEAKTTPSADPLVLPPDVSAPIESGEFFLTERHAIEYAPSIDPANVERLRTIGILTVGDLLRVVAADAVAELRYAGITVEMIESWQAQSLLCCRIPRLKPYDARVLVACGIRTPEQLVRIKPQELREIVRTFATSSDGQAVLMSGTESELSRVTEWISAARGQRDRFSTQDRERSSSRRSRRTPRQQERRSEPTSRRSSRSKTGRSKEPVKRQDTETTSSAKSNRGESGRESIIRLDERKWRFYLDPSADIVDAPSIGPRTAEQLAEVDIHTVEDLLKADAVAIAEKLQNRRVNAATIEQWQNQTMLACRIPQLRGHDAQILVALGINEPETLAQTDADELWSKVAPFVNSKDGKRIIRNGKEPDLDEVRDWIQWAQAARSLKAA